MTDTRAIAVRLTEADLKRLDRLAARDDRTRSQLIRVLIREGLDRREKK